LSRLIDADKPWPAVQAVVLVRQLALAIEVMHQRGIIHRDLKPANVMIRTNGEPVLMDFGLARTVSQRMTAPGQVLGTPAYMSPEQVVGAQDEMGPATDVYSLGVILYELLTGSVPFQGPLMAVFGQILHGSLRPPSAARPGLDSAIDPLCLKAMARERKHRHASMAAFAQALQDYLRGGELPPTLPPRSRVNNKEAPLPANPEKGLAKEFTNSIGMKLVPIPAGKFRMGSPKGEPGQFDDEMPQHEVEISTAFYMGVYLVTQEEYEKVLGKAPSYFAKTGGGQGSVEGLDTRRFPVETVSWEEAQAFCAALTKQDTTKPAGWEYTLPTEAEWEYACRAGTETAYYFGNDPEKLGDYAWFRGNSRRRTHAVGGK
jgi:formylglycine-generating enzyme required for sulfatase activity